MTDTVVVVIWDFTPWLGIYGSLFFLHSKYCSSHFWTNMQSMSMVGLLVGWFSRPSQSFRPNCAQRKIERKFRWWLLFRKPVLRLLNEVLARLHGIRTTTVARTVRDYIVVGTFLDRGYILHCNNGRLIEPDAKELQHKPAWSNAVYFIVFPISGQIISFLLLAISDFWTYTGRFWARNKKIVLLWLKAALTRDLPLRTKTGIGML